MTKNKFISPDFDHPFVDMGSPIKLSWRARLRCAWRLLRGHAVIAGAQLGVADGQLWLIQRNDGKSTTMYGTSVHNADVYQDLMHIAGDRWAKLEKD